MRAVHEKIFRTDGRDAPPLWQLLIGIDRRLFVFYRLAASKKPSLLIKNNDYKLVH